MEFACASKLRNSQARRFIVIVAVADEQPDLLRSEAATSFHGCYRSASSDIFEVALQSTSDIPTDCLLRLTSELQEEIRADAGLTEVLNSDLLSKAPFLIEKLFRGD
jgi:hypothetical protein